MSNSRKKILVEPEHFKLSIVRQCELLGLNRSTYYLEERIESAKNLMLMRLIDQEYTDHPFYGRRRMTAHLRREGHEVNEKRVRRLMQLMGLEAIFPKPRLSIADNEHRKFPYLLNDIEPQKPNQVWSTDITYIRTTSGFLYLVAVIDWFSRYVLSWTLSNTLEVDFCLEALEAALLCGVPGIFNTDQGTQFTCRAFIERLMKAGITISMDGRGRAHDNIFIERFWRSVKYEEVYLKDYRNGMEVHEGIGSYIRFYNERRPHQSLDYKTPKEVHFAQSA